MTTETGKRMAENIVSDVNGNLDVPEPPKRKVSPEAALLFNKGVVARPLMVPEVCSVHIKNLEYRYRWVNHLSQNGRYYMQRKAQGFINATTEDVTVLGGDVQGDKAEITAGDVILMKIRADLYDAAIKYNMEKAAVLTRTRGMYLTGANPDVMSDETVKRVSVANEPFNRSGKAQAFIPENPDALVEDSIKSGRVDRTREVVADLRKEAQKLAGKDKEI